MNKRITSLLLCFVMVFSMLATAVPALAAPPASSCTYSIEADKTSANPGDIINFTIYMQQTGTQNSMEGTLVIPDGLTYVAGSGKVEEGVSSILNWTQALEGVAWTESAMLINGFGAISYTGTDKLALMKFQCTVDNDATAKDYEVTLIDLVADDENYKTKNPTCIPATVTVTIPHVHVYDNEVATEGYLKTGATCTEAAVYYKSCECGAKGTETFTSGSALGHDYTKKVENNTYLKTAASNCTEYNVYWYACSRCDANAKDDAEATDKYYTSTTAGNHSFTEKIEDAAHYVAGTGTDCQSVKKYYFDCAYCDQIGTTTWDSNTYGPHNYAATWSSDADGHWHECSLCHDKKDNETHTPGAAATETTPQKCTECDYIITPALGTQDYIVEMPFFLAVKLTGDKKPAKETFKFEIYDLGCEDAAFEIVKDSVTAENIAFDENGVAFIEGIIKIKVTGEEQLCNLTEGFSVRMVKGSTKGWTYASEQWRIEPFFENDALDLVITVQEIVDGKISEEYANGMSFAVSYEAVSEPDPTEPDPTEPSKPADPQSPQTGDNSMMGLWIALLFVSGFGVVTTAVYGKKRKSVK